MYQTHIGYAGQKYFERECRFNQMGIAASPTLNNDRSQSDAIWFRRMVMQKGFDSLELEWRLSKTRTLMKVDQLIDQKKLRG